MRHEVTTLNTKKALAASLKRFMEKKPLSKITVSEIIADCGVNRKTFYYHFEDIYALLEEEAVEVVKQFDLLADYREAVLLTAAKKARRPCAARPTGFFRISIVRTSIPHPSKF